ncbi:MAG: AGE family epimerase/isomerase [Alphaproteobacteria bacterium]|nr:AGE family epimerase/isomerase [Alphaproteobacteria bacterium SS10]
MSDRVKIEPSTAPHDPWQWMLDTCLPFWAERGVHPTHGGFIEFLDASLTPAIDAESRLRVQARQVYAFSHAYGLSADPRWREVAERGFQYLTKHGWDQKLGGWMHKHEADGTITDRRRDAYDHAFVLFALAHYAHWVDADAAAPLITKTLTFLDQEMADPINGGFVEERLEDNGSLLPAATLPRRQNPHMHLFEAFLALYEATGDDSHLQRADAIHDLFTKHFSSKTDGSLIEYFNEDWSIASGDAGTLREPGHQFEWVWLLHRYAQHQPNRREQALKQATALYQFAKAKGVFNLPDGYKIALDEVDPNGAQLSDTARLWPQTEAIKAGLVMADLGESSDGLADAVLSSMYQHYLDARTGHWCDQITDKAEPVSETVPTSSLYHLMMALTEWQAHRGQG